MPMIRQAIQTKWIGPTNFRGSRIKAKCDALTRIYSWDHSLGVEANHIQAAQLLASELEWSGNWFGGGLPGSGFCFVMAGYLNEDGAVAQNEAFSIKRKAAV
jgi:hypothetical protein